MSNVKQEDIELSGTVLSAVESRFLLKSSLLNPLRGTAPRSGRTHSMSSFTYFFGCCAYDQQGKQHVGETGEAVNLASPGGGCGNEGDKFVIRTVVVVAIVMFFAVITVGLVGFLPIYYIGFRDVAGTAELIQTEAVKGVTGIMRSTILELPDFAYTITANYMLNQTSAYSDDALPNNSLSLLYSLLSVLSSFQETISFFKFYYQKGLYGLASELLWENYSDIDYFLGSNSNKPGILPAFEYDRASLTLKNTNSSINWDTFTDLYDEQGTFKTIVEPWVRHKSPRRWQPDAMNRTGLYFNFIIPFKINGYSGNCEVGMPTRRLLRESKPLIAALRKHGRVMLFDDKRNVVIMNSWRQKTKTWKGNTSHPLQFAHLRLEDINDSLAAAVADQVNLHREELNALVNSTAEFMFPFEGSTVKASFARITDKNGLNILMSVAVLRSDFFSAILRVRAIILSVVIVLVVLSAFMAFLGSYYLVKPLTHLVKALKRASNLELSHYDALLVGRSWISEINDIQADYAKLRRQLCILRNFVPEAILARPTLLLTENSTFSTGLVRMGETGGELTVLCSEEPGSKKQTEEKKILKRDFKLNSGILTEQLNLFSPKHCTVVAIEMHEPGFLENPSKYLSTLVATANVFSGCVEVLGLEKVVVSFGAHTTTPMHSIRGCRFALEFLSKLKEDERRFVSIIVEFNEFFVGACGAHLRNARVLFGIDYLFELTKAMNGAGYHIAATSCMASKLQGYQVFPVDCVLPFSTNIQVVLFELRLQEMKTEKLQRVSRHFRLGFAAMRQGLYEQAIKHYHRIGRSDPQAQRLLRLCTERFENKDVTPYIRRSTHAYNIHKTVITNSYMDLHEDLAEISMSKKSQEIASVDHKSCDSPITFSGSEALFEIYRKSSSSSSNLLVEGCSGADDVPLSFTDMNQKVWTRSLKKISEGAFSTVYLGMSEDGVQVAIKCIPRQRRDIMQESLEAEMNFASKLRHPNIVQYVSCSVVQSCLAIIMEYVPGGSLHTVINNFGRVSPLVARRFTVDILNGLNYLHGIGIVHCDVKPHNVLLGMDGVCKLSDFGSTISEAADMARTLADEVTLRGTALYMAPEVARGGRCTPQSDIFSLGISLLEMLLGRLPWRWSGSAPEGSDAASLHALFNRDMLFVQSLARGHIEPDIPDSLHNEVACFVRSCCHIDPAMRPSALSLLSYAFVL